MKTARYSNGYEDVYKGKRDVKAGWMLILPSGHIISGHSNDAATAEKTARNTAGLSSAIDLPNPRGMMQMGYARYWYKRAGAKSVNEFNAWIADRKKDRADFVASCKIEVVEL